jgi:hypothetical protein
VSEWISVDDRLPEYGEPILVVANGVVQNITLMLDGCDESPDWFEPYFFECDDCAFLWDKATHWMPLPDPPKESDND